MNSNDQLRQGTGLLRQISLFDAAGNAMLGPQPTLRQRPISDVIIEEFHSKDGNLPHLKSRRRNTKRFRTPFSHNFWMQRLSVEVARVLQACPLDVRPGNCQGWDIHGNGHLGCTKLFPQKWLQKSLQTVVIQWSKSAKWQNGTATLRTPDSPCKQSKQPLPQGQNGPSKNKTYFEPISKSWTFLKYVLKNHEQKWKLKP